MPKIMSCVTAKSWQSSQYRRLEIRVIEARGLAKADRFGLSDPYVIIRANGKTQVQDAAACGTFLGTRFNAYRHIARWRASLLSKTIARASFGNSGMPLSERSSSVAQLGRTRTIALTLEPVWTDPEERFVVAVGFEEVVKCDLTLEVWDDDDLGHGDFLGQVSRVQVVAKWSRNVAVGYYVAVVQQSSTAAHNTSINFIQQIFINLNVDLVSFTCVTSAKELELPIGNL